MIMNVHNPTTAFMRIINLKNSCASQDASTNFPMKINIRELNIKFKIFVSKYPAEMKFQNVFGIVLSGIKHMKSLEFGTNQ